MTAEINLEDKGDFVLVNLVGDFNNITNSDRVRETIREISQEGKNKIIINLKDVFYMNSSTLGALLSGNAILSKVKGKLVLYNASEYIKYIFSITKLNLVFQIFETLEEAEECIKKS